MPSCCKKITPKQWFVKRRRMGEGGEGKAQRILADEKYRCRVSCQRQLEMVALHLILCCPFHAISLYFDTLLSAFPIPVEAQALCPCRPEAEFPPGRRPYAPPMGRRPNSVFCPMLYAVSPPQPATRNSQPVLTRIEACLNLRKPKDPKWEV